MRPSKLLRLYAGTTSLFLNRRWRGEKKNHGSRSRECRISCMEHRYKNVYKKKKRKTTTQQQQDKSLTTRVSREKEKTNISVVGKFSVELAR